MLDPRVTKLGQLLTNYCVEVQPGERVMVRGSLASMPLVKETYRAVLQAGGHPHLIIYDDVFNEILLTEGNDDQLNYVAETDKLMWGEFDCLISLRGSENTRQLSSIDPAKQRQRLSARRVLSEKMMKRSAAGELRWVGTLFPTTAHAQDADMSLGDYEDFVYGACLLDSADPISEWMAFRDRQQVLVDWLNAGKRDVKVVGPNAELTLSIADRTFINSHGRRNMPCGEIFTGPVEQSVNGWVRFSYPAIYSGVEVDGIELRFEDGKVVEATAAKNEAFLLEMLNADEGARYLGEFAIGTNRGIQRFTRSILFDEKINGTIHMAVGRSYPETGGQNQSDIHWDMICDMRDGGQIFVDDELFYDSGQFLLLDN